MKVIFFGSSSFSTIILEALISEGIEVPLVVTKAPKEKGRGRKKTPTPVGVFARDLSLNLIETDNPNSSWVENMIKDTKVDTFVLASYGAILKENIIKIARYPLNIHPSLLPKYRGAAPVARALMNGEKKTGFTIFLMNPEVDKGEIVMAKEVPIEPLEVRSELETRLFKEAREPILYILKEIERGVKLKTYLQNESEASYAPKIKKEECKIDWREKAVLVEGKVRGLSYTPGAFCIFRGKSLKLLRAKSLEGYKNDFSPGEIIEAKRGIIVKCGEGAIEVLELQLQGRNKMDAISFINGYHIKSGERLG
ncbi:MAG: methionyl-tRNA formyltransferase [candidate division WOR-3 bacterium]